LEALARRLLAAEQHLSALEVALGAVAIEPVREGAHRAVIEIHSPRATQRARSSTTNDIGHSYGVSSVSRPASRCSG